MGGRRGGREGEGEGEREREGGREREEGRGRGGCERGVLQEHPYK